MQKTLLILSGGREGAKLAQRAKDLNIASVVADSDPEAPAFAHADSCLIADARSLEESGPAAERYHRKIRRIDGVLAAVPEAGTTAAGVISRLGLSKGGKKQPGDRMALQRALSEAGIATPWRIEVETPQALRRVAIEHGHDLILRSIEPHVQAGARPVTSLDDMDRAFLLARQHSPANRVIAEQALKGPQFFVQAAVVDGACHVIAVADKVGPDASPSDERGFDLPADLSEEMQKQIGATLTRACAALGYSNALIHSLIVLHNEQPHILSCDSGVAGEVFWSESIASHIGIDLAALAIKFALDEKPPPKELSSREGAAVAQRHVLAKRGRVSRITGEMEARAASGVVEMQVMLAGGERILASAEPRIAATVLATGVSRANAAANAQNALSKFHIEMA